MDLGEERSKMDIIARENEIAQENESLHGNGDMAVLRDDELNAVTGGVGKTIAAQAKIPDGRFRT